VWRTLPNTTTTTSNGEIMTLDRHCQSLFLLKINLLLANRGKREAEREKKRGKVTFYPNTPFSNFSFFFSPFSKQALAFF